MARSRPIVLIVDDDDQVLDVAAIVLASLGYQVIPATNGEAALEIIKYYRAIDLLMTDIVMPGTIDGWELARRAKRMRPELSVVYTTGFADGALPDKSNPGYGPLLPKPWRADQLVSLVNRALRW
jgi:DNA-binding NtrC family response regulator